MKRGLGLTVVFVMALGTAPVLAGGNVNFMLGTRHMTDDDIWKESPLFNIDLQDQIMYGVIVDFGGVDWPVNIELGIQSSAMDSDDRLNSFEKDEFEASLLEFNVGVLKDWEVGSRNNVRPYVGGGLTLMDAEVKLTVQLAGVGTDSTTFSDTSQGVYAHGGVFWRLGSAFNIGFDGRYVFGTHVEDESEVFNVILKADGDADYYQVALLLGWGWK